MLRHVLFTTAQASPLSESAPHPCGEREPDGDTGFRGGLTCAVIYGVMLRHSRSVERRRFARLWAGHPVITEARGPSSRLNACEYWITRLRG